MEARELRIGNWVLGIPDLDDYAPARQQVDLLILQLIDSESKGSDVGGSWEPIEITEDILQKAGFKISYSGRGDGRCAVSNWRGLDVEILIDYGYFRIWHTPNIYQRKIKYVHELQNLHYAITGEELNIEL